MRILPAALLFLWAGVETSGANYCRPEWRESIHYPNPPDIYQSDVWISPETAFAVIATAIIFFILGKATSSPGWNKARMHTEVDRIIEGRKDEAEIHGKKHKLEKTLDAAGRKLHKAIDDA